MYFLAATYGILSIIVIILYITSSAVMTSSTNQKYDEILREQYKRYFKTYPQTDNPISEAHKLLDREKKSIKNLKIFMPQDESLMDLLKELLAPFPKDVDFNLKNVVINDRIIRIDGSIASSTAIDRYKEQLNENEKFDSVTMNIKSSRREQVYFSMTIKLKIEDTSEKAN